MSETITFRPDPQYATRCWINAILVWTVSLSIWSTPGGIVLALTESPLGGLALAVLPNLIFLVIAGAYIPAWVKSIRYEMTDEEVIVHKGVFGRVHKIVPYRTVTNVSITRAWLDRLWLGIGNVNIQTAGSGGQSTAEERLVGLKDFESIRDHVIAHLRRYRADTRPALGGGSAGAPQAQAAPEGGEVTGEMLEELRAIRRLLEERR